MTQTVLPSATEIEASVLSACISYPESLADAADELSVDDFYLSKHQALWKAISNMAFFKEPVDAVTLAQKLNDLGTFEQAGGAAYLVEIIDSIPGSTNIEHHIKVIKEKRAMRQVVEVSNAGMKRAMGNDPAEETLEAFHKMALGIEIDSTSKDLKTMEDLVMEHADFIEEMSSSGRRMIGERTGYPGLDKKLNGHQKGDLIILAARPSMGKTALAVNIAKASAKYGIPTGVFSLEMPARQLMDRMIADVANIDSMRFYGGQFTQEEHQRIAEAQGKIWKLPLWIDDKGGLKIEQLKARARKYKKRMGLRVLLIDYLQLIFSNTQYDNRNNELGYITGGLKALAKDLDITVVVLSQLNRECEKRPNPNKRPRLSDLRDSGNIEQDADIVEFIYRPEVYGDDTGKYEGHTELIISKNRKGQTGTIDLKFEPEFTRFKEISHNYNNSNIPLGN